MDASMVSLCPASMPSTSNVGSVSAYPRAWASAKTSAKSLPWSRISVRIKLPVPFIIPASHSIRLPLSPSLNTLIMGMPPATAASKAIMTPAVLALLKISLPCSAIKALLAVTTCFPFSIACNTRSLAKVSPPINSRIISISGSATIAKGSVLKAISRVSQIRS